MGGGVVEEGREGCGSRSFKTVEVNLPRLKAPHDIIGVACPAIGATNGHLGGVDEAVG